MGIHNDQAFLSLAENFRQPYHRQDLTAEHILQRKSRAYGRKLVRITYHNKTAAFRQGAKKTVQQAHVHHRHFIYDHGFGLQGVLLVPLEEQIAGVGINGSFQKPVNGGRILAGDFCQTLGCPTCGGCQQAGNTQCPVKPQNTIEQGGLAGTGAAGDD